MSINGTQDTKKSILNQFKAAEGLPFQELLPPTIFETTLNELQYRDRIYSPIVTTSCLLSQVIADDQSLQATVSRLIAAKAAANEELPSANTSAYSQARSRLPIELLKGCFEKVGIVTTENILSGWVWRGKNPKLIDGSTFSMPDTLENQTVYPQPTTQKKGVGFPIARFVVLICFITGVVLRIAIGPYNGKKTGEHSLLRSIIDSLTSNDIVLGDAYYPSYFVLCELIKRGIDFVFPAHAARRYNLKTGKKLGKKDHLVKWKKPTKPDWMEQTAYDSYPVTIEVREAELINKTDGYKTQKRIIITSFLDPISVTKADLGNLYQFRWFVEVDLRSIKTVMKMDILRGKTPEMVEKEVYAHLLAYNLIRQVMTHAAIKHNKNPRNLSFKNALRLIEYFRQNGILNPANKSIYNSLLDCIAYKTVGNRPNRREPRMVKRRPKYYKRLQKPRNFYKNNIVGKAA